MPNMNLGSDAQVILNGPFGSIQLDNISEVQAMPMEKIVSSSILDGTSIKRTVNDGGWKVTISILRNDNTIDALAQLNYNALLTGTPIPNGSCQTTTYNTKTGTSSTYIYSGAAFKITDLGTYQNAKDVVQKLEIEATSRAAA
jgi:hypothetical protein